MTGIEVALIRGGTSRGVVVRHDDLAPAGPGRDRQACGLIGRRAVDGLGGGSPVTDKVVLVRSSPESGVDLDYIVGNVSTDGERVDWSGTCGNMTAAVVPFARLIGLVGSAAPVRPCVARNLATNGLVEITGLVDGGTLPFESGGEVRMRTSYLRPGGAVLGRVLPTGAPRDLLEVAGEHFDVSVVDVTHPYLFLLRDQVVRGGSDDPRALEARIERVRSAVSVRLGLCTTAAEAAALSPAVPRVVLVDDQPRSGADVSVQAVSMGRLIPSLPVTAALAVAAARGLSGTVLDVRDAQRLSPVKVGGPSGNLMVESAVDDAGRVLWASVQRSSRLLLHGRAWPEVASATTAGP